MNPWLDRRFDLSGRGTTPLREAGAGTATFLTMSYVVFVQPAVMSLAGMDFGAVMTATCLSSALACLLMAGLANYPVALAPAMGHNFFFALTVCGPAAAGGMGFSWQEGLAAVFLSGTIFLLLSSVGFRERIVHAIPDPLRIGIAVGIGLLIALLGLEWGGIVVDAPGVRVGLGDVRSGPVLLTCFGVAVIAGLAVRQVPGAILIGLVATAVAGVATGLATFEGVLSTPPSLSPTLFQLDLGGLLARPDFWVVVAVFFILDLFDTVGTLVGLASRGGLMTADGRLPRAERALAADAGGTIAGALLGTSTVTSYIESAAGIAAGGRTGLASVVTAGWFLLALFFAPLAATFGGGIEVEGGGRLYPVIAPALIVVGGMMLSLVAKIDWEDRAGSFATFLTMVVTPLTVSITEGVSVGFVAYSLLRTVEGRFSDVNPVVHLCAFFFILRYAFLS